jgi:hypothetical protein
MGLIADWFHDGTIEVPDPEPGQYVYCRYKCSGDGKRWTRRFGKRPTFGDYARSCPRCGESVWPYDYEIAWF